MRRTFWVVYDTVQYARNKWFADRLVSLLSRSSDARLIIVEKLSCGLIGGKHVFFYEGTPESLPDAVVMRSIYPFLSETFETLGARVFNRAGFSRIANDKRLSYLAASAAGLKTADTLYYDKRFMSMDTRETAEKIGSPFILKTAAGHGGSGVYLIRKDSDLKASVSGETLENGFAAQRMIENAEGDVRVYVLGGDVVAAALRKPGSGFKSNVSLGGRAEAFILGDREKKLVERLYDSLKVKPDLAGFDFITADGEFVFNEMEDVVGTRMLYSVFGIDAAELFCGYVERAAL